MLKAYKSKEIQTNQSGIVSLIIVAILAIVLGLVAIGFSQLTNRELKQAGDRELNAQAFYAAESGVNDALAYLQDPGAAPLSGCNDWSKFSCCQAVLRRFIIWYCQIFVRHYRNY
jgi:Tfp pilus assembly protein PilX